MSNHHCWPLLRRRRRIPKLEELGLMARAGHAAENWERCIYALGEGQLQTPSCSPQHLHEHRLALRQQNPGVAAGAIPSVVHSLHLGVDTGQAEVTPLQNCHGISPAGPTTSTDACKLPFGTCSNLSVSQEL